MKGNINSDLSKFKAELAENKREYVVNSYAIRMKFKEDKLKHGNG